MRGADEPMPSAMQTPAGTEVGQIVSKYGDIIALLVQRIMTAGVPVLVGVAIYRVLGAGGFGQFVLIWTLVTGCQYASEFGLDKFLPREFVEQGPQMEIFRGWVGFKLVLSSALYLSLVLGSMLMSTGRGLTTPLALYSLNLFTYSFTSTYRSFYIARGRTKIIAAAALVGGVSALVLSSAALFTPFASVGMVALILTVCSVVEWAILARTWGDWRKVTPKVPNLLAEASRVWEFALQSILSVLYTRTGILFLGLLGGAVPVATFSMAWTIYSAMSLVPAAAALTIYPDLVRLAHQGDQRQFFVVLRRTVGSNAIRLLPGILILALYGGEIMEIVYGRVDPVSVTVLRVLLVAFLVVLINAILAVSLFALHAQDMVARLSVCSVAWSVCVNLILIPNGLALGAAYGTLLSDIGTACLFFPLLVSRIRAMNPRPISEVVIAADRT